MLQCTHLYAESNAELHLSSFDITSISVIESWFVYGVWFVFTRGGCTCVSFGRILLYGILEAMDFIFTLPGGKVLPRVEFDLRSL